MFVWLLLFAHVFVRILLFMCVCVCIYGLLLIFWPFVVVMSLFASRHKGFAGCFQGRRLRKQKKSCTLSGPSMNSKTVNILSFHSLHTRNTGREQAPEAVKNLHSIWSGTTAQMVGSTFGFPAIENCEKSLVKSCFSCP